MNEKLQRVRPTHAGPRLANSGSDAGGVSLINVYIEIQTKRFYQAQQNAG